MAFPQGINFRATTGYVTDGTNEDYEIGSGSGAANYPRTTAQGNSVGWETTSSTYNERNRNSGNDRRLAGCHFNGSSGAFDYRVDLSAAGDWDVRLAMGDASYAQGAACELFDTSSSLGTLSSGSTSASQRFKDATGTEYTNATWPGSNTAVTKTFSTTICRFRTAGVGVTANIAHLSLTAAAAAGGQPTMRRFGGVPGMGQGQTFGRSW